jgi:uncharacterized protein YcbK (DUF882 family)
MELTQHFSKAEFNSKDGAGMPQEVWANIKILAKQLEALRSVLNAPISITSAYRSEIHNKSIGGKLNSQHLLGKAADIQVKGKSPKQVQKAILKLIKDGKMLEGGLGLYDTFVHYDIRGKASRW